MPEAGKYDQRVAVWANEPTTNPDGQEVEVPVKFIERWASVRPMGGREFVQAQQAQVDLTHQVRMRYDTQSKTITAKHWLTLRNGTRLDIKRVYDVDLRHEELALECNNRT